MKEVKRKVLYKDEKYRTSPKVSIPRKWLGDVEEVIMQIYDDMIVIKRHR